MTPQFSINRAGEGTGHYLKAQTVSLDYQANDRENLPFKPD
jgi:hypothetical protein